MQIKTPIAFLLLILFTANGCISSKPVTSPYEIRFNNMLTKNASKHFTTSKPFATVSSEVIASLIAAGYGQTVYDNQERGFMVVNKNPPGFLPEGVSTFEIPQIMVKYTQWAGGQTRVDFTSGAASFSAMKTAEQDIKTLFLDLNAKGLFSPESAPAAKP